MKTPKRIQEDWVKFSRYDCIEGTIDIWTGDCADNPNNKNQSRWCLNSFSTFIRLNSDEWVECEYRRGVNGFVAEMSEVATAQEIWKEIAAKEIKTEEK